MDLNLPTRSTALLSLLAKGLQTHSQNSTMTQLGDRTGYVGMSDIGRALECLRATVSGKLQSTVRYEHSDVPADDSRMRQLLRRELILQRGHWQEAGIASALGAAGLHLIPQLEIEATCFGVPIKAHLDLTLVWGGNAPAVRILELKSNERLPETLYASNEIQLYGQLGLLQTTWNRPCFNLRDAQGQTVFTRKSFPEVAKILFGIDLPNDAGAVAIEGWVLSVSMSDAKAFGPYQPNRSMLDVCLQTARSLWRSLEDVRGGSIALNDVPTCSGFHPLCDWCEANSDCPKFRPMSIKGQQVELPPEYASDLVQLDVLKEQKLALEGSIEDLENRIRSAFQRFAAHQDQKYPLWLASTDYRFRVATMPGRKSIDQAALLAELLALTGDEDKARDALTQVQKAGQPYERLTIGRINKRGKNACATDEASLCPG
ncbi:hypothetical protein [Desulfocurvibacter africanus]|uniref:hypothetical protein n=1 Tax=Desulfocurvibacter africanus TaxID=873 RepID=UPI000685CF94|nr:hypothetical protein [Desulfocurvibacter africanus]